MRCKANSKINFVLFVCFIFSSSSSRSQNSVKTLQDSLFGNSRSAGCLAIQAASLEEGYPSLGKSANEFISKIKTSIQKDRPDELASLFHPRLKIREPKLRGIFTLIHAKVKIPMETSIYKVFALYSPDRSSQAIHCQNEGIKIHTLYAYPLQFAVWIQILGQKELGRIFLQIVPDKAQEWKIGSFSYEQWTHAGKSPEDWFKTGLSHLEKDPLLAFAELDIAAKLTAKTPYYELDENLDIVSKRDGFLKRVDWESRIKKLLPNWKVHYLTTILAEEGVGLSIRFQVPKELSSNSIREECQKLRLNIKNVKELSGFKGLRCGILLPNESPQNDGQMGSIVIE